MRWRKFDVIVIEIALRIVLFVQFGDKCAALVDAFYVIVQCQSEDSFAITLELMHYRIHETTKFAKNPLSKSDFQKKKN